MVDGKMGTGRRERWTGSSTPSPQGLCIQVAAVASGSTASDKKFLHFFYLLFPIQIHNGFPVSHKSLTPNETAVLQLQMLCWLYAGWDALSQNPMVLKGSMFRSASQFSRPMLNEELISILEHSAWGSKSNHQLIISNWKALAHMFKHVATLKWLVSLP